MKIVLTGGTGCLGSALIPELISAGHEVIALARAGTDAAEGVRYETINLDLSAPLDVSRLPKRCDAMVHLAQSRAYRDFPAAISDVVAINVGATVELAKYASEAGAKAFIFASSGSVYAPSRDRVPETAPTDTSSFYAGSKIAAEALLRAFESKLSIVIMRLFALYGPGQTDKMVAQLAARICEGRPIDLQGRDGHQLTPTFTGDVSRVMRRAISEAWPSGVYNVAAPDVKTLRVIGVGLAEVLNRGVTFRESGGAPPLPTLPDLSKLQAMIGGDRFLSLEEGLRKTFLQGAGSAVAR